MRQLVPCKSPPGGAMAENRKVQLSEEFLKTGLARCVQQHNSNLALLCLEQGENVHTRCLETGRTLYHMVCTEASPMTELKFVPFLYVLSNAGLDLDQPDKDGTTPLQLAIRCGLLELMTALLKCGAQCQGNEEKLAERHGGLFYSEFVTVLRKLWPGYWQAVEQNNTFRVNKLAKSWCRINLSRRGQSLIEFAKTTSQDPKLIKHLTDHEASVELAHAVIAGDSARMKFLLCNQSVDVGTVDLSHKENFFQPLSPLSLYGAALKHGHRHLLAALKASAATNTKEELMEGGGGGEGKDEEEGEGDGEGGGGGGRGRRRKKREEAEYRGGGSLGEGGGGGGRGKGDYWSEESKSAVCVVL